MKKTTIIVLYILILIPNLCYSQTKEQILEEGYKLYNSEKASWLGTDLFIKMFNNLDDQVGGYFSYTEEGINKCIFFNRENSPKVLATFSFSSTFEDSQTKIDSNMRDFNNNESILYSIRKKALEIINADTLFKQYNNAELNIIPIITENLRKVYVLTGPKVDNVLILGNDYLLKFDNDNNLIDKRALHKNIIVFNIGSDSNTDITYHTHSESTGEIITPTDICTLLLYERYTSWKTHLVFSKTKVSIWDCQKNKLIIMTRDAYDKIYSKKK